MADDTNTTATGVGGNTPAAQQQAAQQAATTARESYKGSLPQKWLPLIAQATAAIALLFVANHYQWTFTWLLVAGGVLLVATKAVTRGVKDSTSPMKATVERVATLTRSFAFILLAFTILDSSFVRKGVEVSDAIETCVGGDCSEIQRTLAANPQQGAVAVEAMEWRTFTAPPFGSPPLVINASGKLWCIDSDVDDDGVFEVTHNVVGQNSTARIEVISTTDHAAEFGMILAGRTQRAAAAEAGCRP